MKILPKNRILSEANKIVESKMAKFVSYGYRFPYDQKISTLYTPPYLIISLCSTLGIKNNKSLKLELTRIFNTTDFIEKKYEYVLQVMAFEFEEEIFVVWFNATGKGTTVETVSNDHIKFHNFCLKLLKIIPYEMDKKKISQAPIFIQENINQNGSLKDNYLNQYLII